MKRLAATILAIVACSAPCLGATQRGEVSLDAKNVELDEALRLLSAQGRHRLVPAPDVAKEPITFAIKRASGECAVRWLCRVCGLVVVRAKSGSLVVGKPSLDEAELKEYKVTSLASTQQEADGLLNFIRRVLLAAYPSRVAGEDGEQKPELVATCEKGRLKVLAPPMVQREVITLLRTAAKADKARSVEDLRVAYLPYEVPLLGRWSDRDPPGLRGEVSVALEDAKATEAVWALTSASSFSFFVDPWDPAFAETKVSLSAEKAPLADVVRQLEEKLGADRVWYDGAWVFVRQPGHSLQTRKPLFEGIVVRAYNVSGSAFGVSFADTFVQIAKMLPLPQGLPFSLDRVGDRVLASAPAATHERLEQALTRPFPGFPGRWPR